MIEFYPEPVLPQWMVRDGGYESHLNGVKLAIASYKDLDWSFMARYFVMLYSLASMQENLNGVKHARDFLVFNNVTTNDVLPATKPVVEIPVDPEAVSPRPPTAEEIDAAVRLEMQTRLETFKQLISDNSNEKAEASRIDNLVTNMSNNQAFQAIFGELPPPNEDFNAKREIFITNSYLDLIDYLQLPIKSKINLEDL